MGAFVKGDIVVAPFPYVDFSAVKRRPSLVLAAVDGDRILMCQITSQLPNDPYAVRLEDQHFREGTLSRVSYVRPNYLATCDERIVAYRAGRVDEPFLEQVCDRLIKIVSAG